jgi:ribonuclease-3
MNGVDATPVDHNLYRQACTHSSYCLPKDARALGEAELRTRSAPPDSLLPCMPLQVRDNEQLEFEGDALINFIVTLRLRELDKNADEGSLTQLRARLVNNEHLGKLAHAAGFGKWLIVSSALEPARTGQPTLGILGSLLEAWVGAMYRDAAASVGKGAAFERVYGWTTKLLEKHPDMPLLISTDTNYKSQLQETYQQGGGKPPSYVGHKQMRLADGYWFTVDVLARDEKTVLCSGRGRKLKDAEQDAAMRALQALDAVSCAPAPQP